MQKVETWLPIFPGFYNTLFEPDYEYISEDLKELLNDIDALRNYSTELSNIIQENKTVELMGRIEHTINYDAYDYFDNSGYEKKVCQVSCECIKDILIENCLIKNLKFQKEVSPREYNFYNDSIDIEITFTKKNIANIKKIIADNFDEWTEYLKNRYTSCSGFISHYDNFPESDEWQIDNALQQSHTAGSVLQFILSEILNCNDESLYYYALDDLYIPEFFNYDSFFSHVIEELKEYFDDLKTEETKFQEFTDLMESHKSSLIIDKDKFSIFIPEINFRCSGKFAEKYISNL